MLPGVLLVVTSALCNVYPFGADSFLVSDLVNQYIDYYTWYRSVLIGQGSIFYTSALAMGQDAWGIFSYYLTSPLLLGLPLVPESEITSYVFWMSAAKLGLMQVSCMWYLKKRFNLGFLASTALAICFVYGCWVVTDIRNPMWLDPIILLPLVCWGARLAVVDAKYIYLGVLLGACIALNWYIAYMIVVFSLVMFILESWLCAKEARNGSIAVVGIKRRLLSLAKAYAIALGLSAVVFLPTLVIYSGSDIPGQFLSGKSGTNDKYASFGELLAKYNVLFVMFVLVAVAVAAVVACVWRTKRVSSKVKQALLCTMLLAIPVAVYALGAFYNSDLLTCDLGELLSGFVPGMRTSDEAIPQLSTSVLVIVGCVLFFFGRRVGANARLAVLAVLVFLLVGVWFRPFYIMWCCFSYPHGFYCRNAFLFAFFTVWIAAYGFSCFEFAKRGSLSASAKIGWSAIVVLASFELVFAACVSWKSFFIGFTQENNDEYAESSRELAIQLEDANDEPFRFQKDYVRTGQGAWNEGMASGYNQLSAYASAYDAAGVGFLSSLGYGPQDEYWVPYRCSMLLSDSLLGVKYVAASDGCPPGFVETGLVDDAAGAKVCENPYALPIAYLANKDVLDLSFQGLANPFERQNALVNAMLGSDISVYSECETQVVSSTPEGLTVSVQVPKGCIGYVFATSDGTDPFYMSSDGTLGEVAENTRWENEVRAITDVTSEDVTVNVSVYGLGSASDATDTDSGSVSTATPNVKLYCYALDVGKFESAMEALSANRFDFDDFEDGRISGSIAASAEQVEDCVLLMTVPATDGWSIADNGKATGALDVLDGALTAIALSEGQNDIEMDFVTPGFYVGASITFGTVAVLVALILYRCRKQKQSSPDGGSVQRDAMLESAHG